MADYTPSPTATPYVPEDVKPAGTAENYGPAPVNFGIQIFNGLNEPITIVMRSGLTMTVPPTPGIRKRAVIVRQNVTLAQNVILDTNGLWNDAGENRASPEVQAWNSAILTEPRRRLGTWGMDEKTIDFTIEQHVFDSHNRSVYVTSLDLVISTLNPTYAPKHPRSIQGLRQSALEQEPFLKQGIGFSYVLKIVDNHGRFGHRFVNICGEVFKIEAVKGIKYQDGVYFLSNNPAHGDFDGGWPRSEYYSYAEAEKHLKLYCTYNEAKTLGNPADVYKRELDDRAHALKLKEHDLKMEEAETKRERLEYEQQLDERRREVEREREAAARELAAEKEKLEMRRTMLDQLEADHRLKEQQFKRDNLLLKELHEARNYERKELVEILKYLGSITAGLGGIYLAIKKLKS